MIDVLTADRGDAGHRLDLVVRRHLAGNRAASRTRVQAWIEGGRVSVNGTPVRRAAARVAARDLIAVRHDAPRQPSLPAPEALPLEILYEDDDLIAVNKAPGIVVHPTYRHASGTILNGLMWRARDWPPGQRPSIVGRLDKLTSGLVLAARSPRVHAALQRAAASPHACKEYLALVYGRVDAAHGEIDLRLSRDPRDRRRVVASATAGAPSLTRFARLAHVDAPQAALSLVRCSLGSGRMHQIRVHLASRGWPIVGDPKYGESRWTRVEDPVLAGVLRQFARQALHAWRLEITHPADGRRLRLEAPLPADLAGLLASCGLDSVSLSR